MEISLSNILNEIVEEITQDKTLTEGEDPTASPEDIAAAAETADQVEKIKNDIEGDKEDIKGDEEELGAEDEELMAKLASIFTPEEAAMLADKLEKGEISEDDIIAHLASSESQPVAESYTPTMPIMLAVGVGGLMYRNK